MSSIAMMSLPLHGHVYPMLGLAAELVRRNHEVTFATGTEFAAVVEETGAKAMVYRSGLRSSHTGKGQWASGEGAERAMVQMFSDERDIALASLVSQYNESVPDIVVFDTVTGFAPILASKWKVPSVQFSPTHILPLEQPTHGAISHTAPDDPPCIVAMPPSFQFPPEGINSNHVFTGPLEWQRDLRSTWIAPQERSVLISLGTTFNDGIELMRTAAVAVAAVRPDWEIIVALGRPVSARMRSGWPPSARLEAWVPQQVVLHDASLFITAGGTGSALEAIRASTPMIVLPQAVEQFITARQVATLGLGIAIGPGQVLDSTMSEAINRALALPNFDVTAARMNREMDAGGGAVAAADIVDRTIRQAKGSC